eukprot:gene500-749_t
MARFACGAGPRCVFFVIAPRCSACGYSGGIVVPALLAQGGWTRGRCAPKLSVAGPNNATQQTVVASRVVAAGSTVEIELPEAVHLMAFAERTGVSDCHAAGMQDCIADDGCSWEGGVCTFQDCSVSPLDDASPDADTADGDEDTQAGCEGSCVATEEFCPVTPQPISGYHSDFECKGDLLSSRNPRVRIARDVSHSGTGALEMDCLGRACNFHGHSQVIAMPSHVAYSAYYHSTGKNFRGCFQIGIEAEDSIRVVRQDVTLASVSLGQGSTSTFPDSVTLGVWRREEMLLDWERMVVAYHVDGKLVSQQRIPRDMPRVSHQFLLHVVDAKVAFDSLYITADNTTLEGHPIKLCTPSPHATCGVTNSFDCVSDQPAGHVYNDVNQVVAVTSAQSLGGGAAFEVNCTSPGGVRPCLFELPMTGERPKRVSFAARIEYAGPAHSVNGAIISGARAGNASSAVGFFVQAAAPHVLARLGDTAAVEVQPALLAHRVWHSHVIDIDWRDLTATFFVDNQQVAHAQLDSDTSVFPHFQIYVKDAHVFFDQLAVSC